MTVLFAGVEREMSSPREGEDGRTDTMVLARVDPAASQVRLLVVPRDLWVPLTGTDEPARISSAFLTGGPVRLIGTIEEQLGIAPDRYVEADFASARGVVDALGGLRLSVDHPVTAESTGLDLDAGCQVLDGEEVLALGRARKRVIVEMPDGSRMVDASGDFGRQDRAAVIAAALLQAVGEAGP